EDLLAKCAHELLGINRPHATDHAGRKVSLDALDRRRRRGAQEPRFELLAVRAVIDPLARGHDPFAGGNGSRMPHHRHGVSISTRPRAQHAETILSIVVGHSFDKPASTSPVSVCGLMRIIIAFVALAKTLSPISGAISISRLCVIRFGLRRGTSHKQT